MKKFLLLVSCFAVVLILSNMSVADVVVADGCPCPAVTSSVALPWNHPGLNLNQRDVRRAVRLDARITTRQDRLEYRHNPPSLQAYPYLPGDAGVPGAAGVAASDANVPFGFSSGPIAQTGKWNSNTQRVTAGNNPVINFMSIVRPGSKVYAVGPAQ